MQILIKLNKFTAIEILNTFCVMPLYEGVGLVGDRHAVVFDIGIAYTKCGFATEFSPRFIIPSEIYDWKTEIVTKIVDICRKDEHEQFDIFVKFFHQLYYKYLLVNPKERRVVIVESVLSPTDYRNLLAKVLFKHFEVPSIIFVPAHLMACFPLGTQSALVVDVGYVETLVLPIFEGVPMLNCWQASPFGGKSVHKNLEKLLKTNGKVKSTAGVMALSQYPELLSESILEDIKVRTCFVTHMDRGRMIQAALADPANQKKIEKTPPDVEYPLEGDKVLVLDGFVREAAFEVLFQHDEDDKSLAQLILDSVLKCPIDLRRPLLERIHVIGGGCMVPGFLARLKSELTDLLNDENLYGKKIVAQSLKFFKSPAKENFASWLGASIFGGLEILPHRSVSREQFQAKPTIPDWTAGADGIVEPTADIQQQR